MLIEQQVLQLLLQGRHRAVRGERKTRLSLSVFLAGDTYSCVVRHQRGQWERRGRRQREDARVCSERSTCRVTVDQVDVRREVGVMVMFVKKCIGGRDGFGGSGGGRQSEMKRKRRRRDHRRQVVVHRIVAVDVGVVVIDERGVARR